MRRRPAFRFGACARCTSWAPSTCSTTPASTGSHRHGGSADELGALSTAAVLDIQLAGAHLLRFEPDAVIRCATSALDASGRLRSNQLRATALAFLAEAHGLRQDGDAMERHNILALAAAPGDAEIAGSVWGGRGVAALLADDRVGAARALRQAVELLTPLENSGPGLYLGFWPLLLAMTSSADAEAAIGAARSTGMTVNRGNRGLLLIAEAVLAGRSPTRRTDAEDLLGRGRTDLVHFPVWSDLALLARGTGRGGRRMGTTPALARSGLRDVRAARSAAAPAPRSRARRTRHPAASRPPA